MLRAPHREHPQTSTDFHNQRSSGGHGDGLSTCWLFPMCRLLLLRVSHLISFSQEPYEVGTTVFPILQIRRLRHREEFPLITELLSDLRKSCPKVSMLSHDTKYLPCPNWPFLFLQ